MGVKKVNYYCFKQALKISKIVFTTKFIFILLVLHDLFGNYYGFIILFSSSVFLIHIYITGRKKYCHAKNNQKGFPDLSLQGQIR